MGRRPGHQGHLLHRAAICTTRDQARRTRSFQSRALESRRVKPFSAAFPGFSGCWPRMLCADPICPWATALPAVELLNTRFDARCRPCSPSSPCPSQTERSPCRTLPETRLVPLNPWPPTTSLGPHATLALSTCCASQPPVQSPAPSIDSSDSHPQNEGQRRRDGQTSDLTDKKAPAERQWPRKPRASKANSTDDGRVPEIKGVA